MYIRITSQGYSARGNRHGPSGRRGVFKAAALRLLIVLLAVFLAGCQVEVYRGLTEPQVNTMLSALLRRNIPATKVNAGKTGFTLSVDESNLVQALEVLKENSLPGEKYQSLGTIFSGQGMISSPTEEQARLSFAISQELASTFSRIDGVLNARVHVVLAQTDQATDAKTEPSAAVFLRHTPDSPVVDLVAKVRELTAKAVPGLGFEQVSVMLVPVREAVSVPYQAPQGMLGLGSGVDNKPMLLLVAAYVLVALCVLVLAGGALYALVIRKRRPALPPGDPYKNEYGGQ